MTNQDPTDDIADANVERLIREAYRPEAVMVETRQGRMTMALCWIAPPFMPAATTDDYLDRITGPARDFHFPDWYIERLESFRGGPKK